MEHYDEASDEEVASIVNAALKRSLNYALTAASLGQGDNMESGKSPETVAASHSGQRKGHTKNTLLTSPESSTKKDSPTQSNNERPKTPHKTNAPQVQAHQTGESPSPSIGQHEEEANTARSNSPTLYGQRSTSESRLFSPVVSSDNMTPSKGMSKKDSLKVQKKHYRKEKKRAAKELLSTLKDPSVIVMSDFLKVRGTLKGWTKLYCVLKPGLLVLYKSSKAKSGHWVGTILLNCCELIERPSKKDGFCFKLYHPLDQSIWATRGPKGESIGAITQPLPYSYLIFRASSESAGKTWMDGLELALRCSSLLMKSMKGDRNDSTSSFQSPSTFRIENQDMNESDCEKHFQDVDLDEERTDKEQFSKSDKSESETESEEIDRVCDENLQPLETTYLENMPDELGEQGASSQTEEVADENKSIIWTLVKQVRPGMDLSKVVLPTFILEPYSLLEKFSNYYYHADLLSEAALQDDPYSRLKLIVKWYLSGFYKKPKGLKKPYNPILGETYRCYWRHPKTNSRTFYIAEQLSHHPPVSAFHLTNRQDGFSLTCGVLAKSKFYGNSLSAIMDGVGRLSLLKRGEDYTISMPYAHCKGILIGTLSMELGGKVVIECEKTGYRADLEFKLKPFMGGSEHTNKIHGKLKLGNETLAVLDGKWDSEITLKDKDTGLSEVFWQVTPEIKERRLKRHSVPLELQGDMESEKLWYLVSEALAVSDQEKATQEKFYLEDEQRKGAKERKLTCQEWVPKLFEQDTTTGEWVYKYADLRPWDPNNDVVQYECDYIIRTKTRHKTPLVRTTSILSVSANAAITDAGLALRSHTRQSSMDRVRASRVKRSTICSQKRESKESGSSTPDNRLISSSDSEDDLDDATSDSSKINEKVLKKVVEPLHDMQRQNNEKLTLLQQQLLRFQRQTNEGGGGIFLCTRDWMILALVLLMQTVLQYMFK